MFHALIIMCALGATSPTDECSIQESPANPFQVKELCEKELSSGFNLIARNERIVSTLELGVIQIKGVCHSAPDGWKASQHHDGLLEIYGPGPREKA